METDTKAVSGRLAVFLIGQTDMNLAASDIVEIKTLKSAPSYLDVIPKQKVIKWEKREVGGAEVAFLVKAYLPDYVVVEASVEPTRPMISPCVTLPPFFSPLLKPDRWP